MNTTGKLIIDPVGGIAGDMFLGLLIDLGAPVEALRAGLERLGLPGWALRVEPAERRHVGCTRAIFDIAPERGHRHLPEILARIEAAGFGERARAVARDAFRHLAEAEARVHRIGVNEVHFHEVGAADAILDVCGVALGLEVLGIDEVHVTPLPAGSGTVHCDHGELPVPVPAVLELCAGHFELVAGRGQGETVTPTGAALLRAVARPLAPGVTYLPQRVGYGAGTRSESLVRGTLATTDPTPGDDASSRGDHGLRSDEIVVLSTNVDDRSGASLAFAAAELMEAGALDVTLSPTTMKKGRPATIVQVMARPADEMRLALRLLELTGSIGARHQRCRRSILPRTMGSVRTPWGEVPVKIVSAPWRGDGAVRVIPEYEDCAALARSAGRPVDEVIAAAIAAHEGRKSEGAQ